MQTAQRNSLRLLQWMMVASLALPLALLVFASAVSWVSIQQTADREIERSLDVAHEHALKVFETIDRSLSEMAEIVRDVPDADIVAREPLLHLRLKQLVASLPQVKSAWIFDARGRALVNSLVVPAPGIDFSDRDYFKSQTAGDIGTYIGEALQPRAPYQGASFFGVSRRRPSEDGSFAGVLQASVFPEYFENYYARIGREPGSYFALGRTDGAMLAQFPAIDRDVRTGPIGELIEAGTKAGIRSGLVTVTSPADGIERRVGYRRLAEYPIDVAAGLETSAIRARWLSTVSQHLVFGAPATALLFALLGLALRRTRHLHFEAEKRRVAEEALKHGQRLEALGQLTGGVAHDFNNLLTVIRASADLLRRPDLPEARRLRYIDAISDTVTRAAKLTAQLLAFARRQTLKPEVFEVGRSVYTLNEMIGTLVGSRIEIVILGPEEPCFVNADAGQFETAIINMAVNARDAMEGQRTADDRGGHGGQPAHRRAIVAKSHRRGSFGPKPLRLCRGFRRRHRQRHSARTSSNASSSRSSRPSRSATAPGSACRRYSASPGSPAAKWPSPARSARAASSRCICRATAGSGQSRPPTAEDARALDGRGMSVLVVEDNIESGNLPPTRWPTSATPPVWSAAPRMRSKNWPSTPIVSMSCSPTW